jgi:hypothetical protein
MYLMPDFYPTVDWTKGQAVRKTAFHSDEPKKAEVDAILAPEAHAVLSCAMPIELFLNRLTNYKYCIII